MWTATKITADIAEKIQVNAGLLLNKFDITHPTEPKNSDIICDTTGNFSITLTAETQDFFDDVNNAPKNTKQGKRITGWTGGVTVTSISITNEALKTALGAADVGEDGGVHPRMQYKPADFKSFYWIGDMIDEDKLLCIVLDNTVSTGGISLTTQDRGKGGLAITLTPHADATDTTKVPMAFYILEKEEGAATTYTVQQNLTNVDSTFTGLSVEAEAPFTATLTPETGYTMSTVTITMGENDVTETAYTAETGVISIASVTGALVITATATEASTYTVTNALTHVTNSNDATTVTARGSYAGTLTAESTYTISTVTVTMGGNDVTNTTYTTATGEISIAEVTGNVVITATATEG